jgi:TetR/AcrR family transcriptional regulator, cholesterol catabolism regulator
MPRAEAVPIVCNAFRQTLSFRPALSPSYPQRAVGSGSCRHSDVMERPPADAETQSAARIRAAAIALFRQRGYHGATVRELASAVQMETASLYYHYPSKQDLLVDLIDRTMDRLIAGVQQSVADVQGAEARLRAALRFHVDFHTAHQDEAFVSHSELRALEPDNLRRIVAKRDRYEGLMRELLSAGVDEGVFSIADVRLLAKAVLMMCSGVSDWFGPDGRLSPADVARGYVEMVLRMVRAPSGERAAR